MKLNKVFLFISLVCSSLSYGQANLYDSYKNEGEFGIAVGAGHYFGDLNTRAALNKPNFSAGIYFIKQFNNYIGVRISGDYAFLAYSDVYSDNETQRRRNLSFNSNVWELALQGDFNFFRFMPGEPGFNFTPYITLGVGAFSYDPFAYLQKEKIYLRSLPVGTEGQGSALYPDRKPYRTMGICIPFGAGIKYSLNERFNIAFEVLHRYTNTDYLDDVSKTYVDPSVFPANPDLSPSQGLLLSDRSGEVGEPIGLPGRQRGNSKQKDQFITAMFHLTFNLQSYRCPTAN